MLNIQIKEKEELDLDNMNLSFIPNDTLLNYHEQFVYDIAKGKKVDMERAVEVKQEIAIRMLRM